MNNPYAAAIALGLALQGTMAFGQGFEDAILSQLRAEGYVQISVNTTILGRTRIVAKGQQGQREIVLNPRTGEVLRDVWFVADTTSRSDSSAGRSGGGSSGGSAGRDDDDNDDDRRADDDRSDDDRDDDRGGGDDDDRDDDRSDDDDGDDDGGKGRGRGRGGDD